MADMFEGLNDIPWADLSSAYGNADELPIWIRRLSSDNSTARKDAARCIGGEVQHQGTLYTSSAEVMPFLIRLLQEPSVKDKDLILGILGAIAFAYREWEQAGSEEYYDTEGQLSSLTMPLVKALLPKVLHATLPLVDHEDVAVRMQAAQVLSCLPHHAPSLLPVLRGALAGETDQLAQINFVLALGKVSHGGPEDVTLFERYLRDEDELMRFAAAQSLALSATDLIPDEAVAILVDLFSRGIDTLGAYWQLPCAGSWLWHDASEALYQLNPKRLSIAYPRLLEAYAATEDRSIADSLASLLVHLVIYGDPPTDEQLRGIDTVGREPLQVIRRAARAPEPAPATRPTRRSPSPFAPFSDRIRAALPATTIWRMQRLVDRGQNNDIVAAGVYIGDTTPRDVIFRFPKHAQAINEMERELRLLHALQGKLPLPVPNPIYSSLEPREVGQVFIGYAKLPGKPLYREMLESVPGQESVQRLAEQLGSFLCALHTLPVDEVFDFDLPIVGSPEKWASMFADIREMLFPLMRPDAREQITEHFERALDDPAMFAYTPVLIHGDFGASNILYDARARTISGIIDWSSAEMGDPATDLAALICPVSYGEGFAERLIGVYPGVEELLPRARFYVGTFALQEALFGVEHDDAEALARGLAEYV